MAALAILALAPAFLLFRDDTLCDPITRLWFSPRLSFIVRSLALTDAPFFLGLLTAGILVVLAVFFAQQQDGRRHQSPVDQRT